MLISGAFRLTIVSFFYLICLSLSGGKFALSPLDFFFARFHSSSIFLLVYQSPSLGVSFFLDVSAILLPLDLCL